MCWINISYSQKSGFAESDGVKIHYRDFGNGTPIVLLSGGPGFTSDDLLHFVEKLKNKFRLILVDQRGTGKSNLELIDSTTITLDNYVEDINNVRKHLKINEWIVLGHSWGGLLGMALTAKYPKNTSRLVLIGSMGIDTEHFGYAWDNVQYSIEEKENIKYWSNPEVKIQNPERAAYEMYSSLLPGRLYNKEAKREILKNFVFEPNSFEIASLMFIHLKNLKYDLKPKLVDFKKPVLIIQGRQGFLGGWTAFTIFQTFPNCEIEFIEKCGHFPFEERPMESYKVLNEFLNSF